MASYGEVGHFYTSIKNKEGIITSLEHGVVVIAAGGTEASTSSFNHDKSEAIITQKRLEQEIANNSIDAGKIESVVMIQCVDSRLEPRNYCSRLCCSSALKQALALAEVETKNEPEVLDKVNEILKEAQLHLNGRVHVGHLLDILSKDLGPEIIRSRLKRSPSQFRIAPYYGCQCLRPYPPFDDPESPRSMEPLIEATGATIHPCKMGSQCCAATHMNTKMEAGFELVGPILKGAQGADAIVTECPMYQINLEAYQQQVSKINRMDLRISILYLPQLLGFAIALQEKDLRLDLNLSITKIFRKKLKNIIGESL